jgi:hypothetical protein
VRVKFLCLLVVLALAAPAAWCASAAEPSSSSPGVTLADILAPVPAQDAPTLDLGLLSGHHPQEKLGCFPKCTTNAQCQDLCACTVAVCQLFTGCPTKSCNCSPCP